MKKIWKNIFLVLCFIFLAGCSSIQAVRVPEKSIITKDDKTILMSIDDTSVITKLYSYYDSREWKIFEQTDKLQIPQDKGVIKSAQSTATFSVKYSIRPIEKTLLLTDWICNGYVTIVDLRTNKIVTSIVFERKTQKEIYQAVITEFEKNVIYK